MLQVSRKPGGRNESMSLKDFAAAGRAAMLAVALILCGSAAKAQEPSANAIALARELIELKGGLKMYEPVIPGVIEKTKRTFLQVSPTLSKDLNEVAAQMRTEYAPRSAELNTE